MHSTIGDEPGQLRRREDRVVAAEAAQGHHRLTCGDDQGGGILGARRGHEVESAPLVRLQIAHQRRVNLATCCTAAWSTEPPGAGRAAIGPTIRAAIRTAAKSRGARWGSTIRPTAAGAEAQRIAWTTRAAEATRTTAYVRG